MSSWANTSEIRLDQLPLSNFAKAKVKRGGIHTQCQVKNLEAKGKKGAQQSLNFAIAGLHQLSCKRALRTISQYESLKNWSPSFINRSDYNSQTQFLTLGIKHRYFPIPLRIHFQLPRIKRPGVYPYQFKTGILPGLKGNITVFEHAGRCAFFTDAHWVGPDTGYPNTVLEIFIEMASRVGMRNIFRFSSLH